MGVLLFVVLSLAPDAGTAARVLPITTRSPEARELFLSGRLLSDNARTPEAAVALKKAVKLDDDFALAWAYLGFVTPGPEGLTALDRAVALSARATEDERLFIGLLAAERHGQMDKAVELGRQLSVRLPEEWHATFELGQIAYDRREFESAISAYRKSMALSQELRASCTGYNNLGYAQAMVGHLDLGLLALKKCVELVPSEPNTHDSLGEMQLAAGKFPEAERSFKEALARQPDFALAEQGVAMCRLQQGDRAGGLAHLKKGLELAVRADERAEFSQAIAWALLAGGDEAGALKQLDAAVAELRANKAGAHLAVQLGLVRAEVLLETGHAKDALPVIEAALRSATELGDGELPTILQRRALARKAWAQLALGGPAQQTVDLLEADMHAKAGTVEVGTALIRLRAALRLAAKDSAQARIELAKCKLMGMSEYSGDGRIRPEDTRCLLDRAQLELQLGDEAAALAIARRLATFYSRDPIDLVVHKKAQELLGKLRGADAGL